MHKKPEVLQRALLATTKLFQIEQVSLRFSNGETREYERFRGRGFGVVLVVALLNPEEFLLVREYAAGTERYEVGLPKGLIEKDEDPLIAANRELQEEVGYAAKKLTPLATLTTAPGYSAAQSYVILAEDLHPAKLPGDEPEEIEVKSGCFADLTQLFNAQDFTEARSIAALYMARDYLLQREKT